MEGEHFAGQGIRTAVTGGYGETLGGRLGPTYLKAGMQKILSLAIEMSGFKAGEDGGPETDFSAAFELLSLPRLNKPWYLAQAVWDQVPGVREEINADVEWGLRRLLARGVRTYPRLIEAFLNEYSGAFMETEMLLSLRGSLDVSLPFAGRELLRLAGSFPMHIKVHNNLNRLMLVRNAPDLAKPSTAATLIPASVPIPLQEASRLLRRTRDQTQWRLHSATKGLVPIPRPSWWQLEFLRDGVAFHDLVDDLKADIWDRETIRTRITDNADNRARLEWRSSTALLSQQMLIVATLDRMFR
ncbi:MAG: hypothetical protein GX113_08760 [Actinobacteria bacterium]|jgi:hypothetical protein|nr:hypothetical protein [Actinomycetota bacterium]